MALIREFEFKPRERNSLHEEISATYSVFEKDGRVLFQIDTYGRPTRDHPGKQSQTIQLDMVGASKLIEILRREFKLD